MLRPCAYRLLRSYSWCLLWFALIAQSIPAGAQACYTPITSWVTTYDMTASGEGKDKFGVYNWTVSHQTHGEPNLPLAGGSCTGIGFGGIEFGATGTASDHGSAKCGDGSPNTIDVTGGPFFDEASSLGINVAGGVYTFWDDVTISSTVVTNSCGNVTTETLPFGLSPVNSTCTGSITTPVFALPATIQPLSQSGVTVSGDTPYCVPATWTLDFTLIPVYKDDDDCKKKGGSTVGCLNQSLGEDMGIVGTGMYLHYEGGRLAAGGGDSVSNADALMIGGWTLSVHHAYNPMSQTLYLGDGGQRNGYQLGVPVTYLGNTLITSTSGDEVYVFSATGQHLQTLRPLTGALLYQFGYDGASNLVTVTDASGNVTTIKRNGAEQATAIVSPYAQGTVLTMDSNGFLAQIKDPLGKLQSFTNTAQGQIIARTDANGNVYSYTYDDTGRLIKDADPVGGFHALARTDATTGVGRTVAHATAMGLTSSYQTAVALPWSEDPNNPSFSQQQTNIWPNGLHATSSKSMQNGQLEQSVALPDGTSESETFSPDPVWGLQVPVTTAATLTEGSLTMRTTGGRATTLGAAGNPFSIATQTDTATINGRVYTSAFTGSNLTYAYSSPVGRTITIALDSQERPASLRLASLTPTSLAYTSKGRLASTTQGARHTAFTYNTKGFLASATDPLNEKTSFAYDADGRLLTTTLADSRVVQRTYDANGNLLSIIPPGKSAHAFTYTDVDLPASFTPPGAPATTYAYDLDRHLTSLARPGGQSITYDYDTAGRVTKVVTPTATDAYIYSGTTGNISAAVRGAEHLSYSYNGPLLTRSTWTGTVTGNVSDVYNSNFWVTSQAVNGGSPVAFQLDNDGLITGAGSLTVKRSATNGLITGTTLGVVSDTRTYNSFGELTGYTASVNGAVVYKYQLTRNAAGRITAKTETIGGATNSYSYTYDLTARVTVATKNAQADSYAYDSNSNRLSGTTGSVTANGTYDAQDRLLTYGAATYTYTQAGDTSSQTIGTQKTSYTYDALGNLTAVTLPNATKITYVIDAENNRVGKTVNGVLAKGFLYDAKHVVAELNGSNQLVSQFVYATKASSPDYMIGGGSTYRLLSDTLGSPVLAIDTTTGVIAEQLTYDEFGNVLSDTNPGFQPFGFAGGLYDQDTKLVRFGARDYNPSVGRWTAKDPTLFAAGDTNLYGYVASDPLNFTDPSGLGDCDKKAEDKKDGKTLKQFIVEVLREGVRVGDESTFITVGSSRIGVVVLGTGAVISDTETNLYVNVPEGDVPEKKSPPSTNDRTCTCR